MQKTFFFIPLIFSANLSFGQIQSELNGREHAKYVKIDNELNSTYQKILKE